MTFPVRMALTSRNIKCPLNWLKQYEDALSQMRTLELLQAAGVVQLMDQFHQRSRSTFFTLLYPNADLPLPWQGI